MLFFTSIRMSNCSLNQIEGNEIEDDISEDIINLSKLERKDKVIKDKVLRDIRALFESDEDDYYKPIKTVNAFNSNYNEHDSNGDKDNFFVYQRIS